MMCQPGSLQQCAAFVWCVLLVNGIEASTRVEIPVPVDPPPSWAAPKSGASLWLHCRADTVESRIQAAINTLLNLLRRLKNAHISCGIACDMTTID